VARSSARKPVRTPIKRRLGLNLRTGLELSVGQSFDQETMPAAVARATELISSMRHLLWVGEAIGPFCAADLDFGRFVTAHSIDLFVRHSKAKA
jgi:hypothetical protein